jgi:hypothetical protein
LWYGLKKRNQNNFKKINYTNLYIHIPYKWNFISLTSNVKKINFFIFFSKTYIFKFRLLNFKYKLFFDKNLNLLTISFIYTNNFSKIYWNLLNLIFNSFYKPFFQKIKFKGKGYYVFKTLKNTITFQFCYSHRLYLYSYFSTVIFLTKTVILLFGLLKKDVLTISSKIKDVKPLNIYTGRGIRFSKQIVYKKTGKVSSYR